MESNQFPQYFQLLEDGIGAFSEYLFGKYNDFFDIFYVIECDKDIFDKSCINCTLMNGSELEAIQNS